MNDEPIDGFPVDRKALIIRVKRAREMLLLLGRRGRPVAAVVPVELANAAEKVGGADAATLILLDAARTMAPPPPPSRQAWLDAAV